MVAARRARRALSDLRPLRAGLAADGHRLELAAGTRARRRDARRRRHRLPLARSDRLHHRPTRERGLADFATFLPVRKSRLGPVETFATEVATQTVTREITTEDAAVILLRFQNGARGSVSISQISAGRKNSLQYEIDGSGSSVAWDSEQPDQIWLGHRERPNELLLKNPALWVRPGKPLRPCQAGTSRASAIRLALISGRSMQMLRREARRTARRTPRSPTVTMRCWSMTPSRDPPANAVGSMSSATALLPRPTPPPPGDPADGRGSADPRRPDRGRRDHHRGRPDRRDRAREQRER